MKTGRRAFLRGAAGASLALPTLELMLDGHGEALAGGSAIPQRYAVFYVPAVIGANRSGRADNPNANPDINETYVPDVIGFDYDLKAALAPFAEHDNIKDEIAVISNLRIPEGEMRNKYHDNYFAPLMCGIPTHPDDRERGWGYQTRGPSSDMIVKDHIGQDSLFEFLAYGVQASRYGGPGPGMSFMGGNNNNTSERVIPQNSPRQAYDDLFFNFVDETDPSAVAEYEYQVASRTSVLDLVSENINRLQHRLGSSDQQVLERHLSEVRALEQQISALPPPAEAACQLLPDPGEDPEIGGNAQDATNFGEGDGYSDEDGRARVFADLVHMAFACDLTRVISFQFAHNGSYMNTGPLMASGISTNWHALGHGDQYGSAVMAELLNWPYKHFAYLVAKLRDTPVGAGQLIDHCALTLVHEGGAQPLNYSGNSPHHYERAACLLAGRAGGLMTGQHIDGGQAHPARVFVTAMRAVGVDADLGNQSEPIPGLLPG